MKIKIINDLNIRKQARELGVPFWSAPSFLFIMMGIITLIAMTATYFLSRNYDDPSVLVIAESIVVIAILAIGNSIIQEVEQMAHLNKLKSEFVFVASHQLRTPLSAIRWQIELLLSKFGDGLSLRQQEGLHTVDDLSLRLVRLVSDLLDVARIDQGRLALKKEQVSLGALVEDTLKGLRLLAEAKNIELTLHVASGLPMFTGDPDKLKLAVDNLISNAIKYTLNGGRVEISLIQHDGSLIFRIRDNGVGIPQYQQKQVFNKFFRSDNVVKFQTEGTGLGLYIAKNVIEQSGGKLWFESEENVGSTFNFSLPLASK